MKSSALIFSFLLTTSLFSHSMAQDLPKGNETGNRLAPSEALSKMIKEETVFKIDKEYDRCPSIIQLQQFDGSGFANGRKAEKDDIPFRLGGYKEEKNRMDYDHFTHGNYHFIFKPKLKGKSKNFSDGCSIAGGIACRSDYQITGKHSVQFEGSARIYMLAGVISADSLVEVNPEKKTVTYTFKANDIDDVVCQYSVAPSETKSKVAAFNTQREAEELAYEESMKVNNTSRSSVKEVDQRSPAANSPASKTQSK